MGRAAIHDQILEDRGKPPPTGCEPGRRSRIGRWFPILPIAALIATYGLHLYHVAANAVDVPFWDEWWFLRPDALPRGLTFEWVAAFHNVHRLIPTKLQIYLLYQLNGWNLATQQVMNFLLFGAVILYLIRVAHHALREYPHSAAISCAFGVFFFSTLCYPNHVWGVQSVIHFSILFILLTARSLFASGQQWYQLLAGVVAAWCAMYSNASGVVAVTVLLLVFSVFKVARGFHAGNPHDRRREYGALLLVGAAIGAGIGLWFVGYGETQTPGALLLPAATEFWHFWLNLVSFGCGIRTMSTALGAVCLGLIVLPVLAETVESRGHLPTHVVGILALLLAALAITVSITVGRGYHPATSPKTPRFGEFAMLVPVLGAVAWGIWLQRRKRFLLPVIVALWGLLFVSFLDDWSFSRYRRIAQRRIQGLQCLDFYYHHGGPAMCPTLHPVNLARFAESARALDVSFYRHLEEDRTNAPGATPE
ncbi:MAG: hypothetical protein GY856_39495 [bacterium]|nr:hypothetical protein [bacterium]